MTVNPTLMKAILAMDVYNRGYNQALQLSGTSIGNATVIADSENQGPLLDNSGNPVLDENNQQIRKDANFGFYAVAYGYGGETIISYRGTDEEINLSAKDFLFGYGVGAGIAYTAQSAMAFEFYRSIAGAQTNPSQANISVTGHSLGGGLAGLVGAAYQKSGLLFNNMAFEGAVDNLEDITHDPNAEDYDAELKGIVYGSASPWSTSFNGLQTLYMQGEALNAPFIGHWGQTETPRYMITVDEGVEGLGYVDRHSMSFLVIQLFAGMQGSVTAWDKASPYFLPVLFDNAFAGSIGIASGQLGTDVRDGNYASILRTMIAYSALDEGTRPFGDTGIRALHNDANDLGQALAATTPFAPLLAYASGLSYVFTEFAAKLAKNTILGTGTYATQHSVLQGVLNLVASGTAVKADFSNEKWLFDGSGTAEVKSKQKLLESLTLPQAQKQQILDSIDHFGAVTVAATNNNFVYTLAPPSVGNLGDAGTGEIVIAGSRNDTIAARLGGDVIIADAGTDTVDYSALAFAIEADLTTSVQVVVNKKDEPNAPADTLMSVEGIIGTAYDDAFKIGEDGARGKVIAGGQGSDTYDLTDYINGGAKGPPPKLVEKPDDSGTDEITAPNDLTPENTTGRRWADGSTEIIPDDGSTPFRVPKGMEKLNGRPIEDYVDEEVPNPPPIDMPVPMDLQPRMRLDPLVLDLDGDGIELTALSNSHAYFGLLGNGLANRTGWVTGGDGFLVQDLNDNGKIDDVSELFGDGTTLGFAELTTLDSNTDGKIDASDDDWGTLKVWIDANENGLTDAGELHTLASLGITEFSLNPTQVNTDINGNTLFETATFKMNGNDRTAGEVFFLYDQTNTVWRGEGEITWDALLLPELRGWGEMANNTVAMSLDEDLLEMGQNLTALASLEDFDDFRAGIKDYLFKWAGVENVDPDSRGAEPFTFGDAQRLAFLEEYSGKHYTTPTGSPSDPQYQESWQAVYEMFEHVTMLMAVRFFVQAEDTLSQVMYYDLYEDRLALLTDDAQELEAAAPTGSAQEEALYWAMLAQARPEATSQSLAVFRFILEKVAETGGDLTTAQKDYFNYDIGSSGNDQYLDGVDKFRPEIVVGGDGDDAQNSGPLVSNVSRVVFHGGAGSDTLRALGEGGILIGGTGNDSFFTGTSESVLFFRPGDGQDTIEYPRPAAGYTRIVFDASVEVEDVTYERQHRDLLITYSTGGDSIRVKDFFLHNPVNGFHFGIDEVIFSDGTVHSENYIVSQANEWSGTNNADNYGANTHLYGTEHDEIIYALDGDDDVWANGGNDTVHGGQGNDRLYGGDGDDHLYGDAGNDTLFGNDGNDALQGGVGADNLYGGLGGDSYLFSLGDGQDLIQEDGGFDAIVFDQTVAPEDVTYQKSGSNLIITYGTGGDQITVSGFFLEGSQNAREIEEVRFHDQSTHDLAHIYRQVLTLHGTGGNDTLTGLSSASRNYPNVLYGYGGHDILTGGNGNDTLVGGSGNDGINGASGDDLFIFDIDFSASGGYDSVYEGASQGFDTIRFTEGMAPADFYVWNDTSGYLWMQLATNPDDNTLRIQGTHASGTDFTPHVERVEFDDQTVWDLTQGLYLRNNDTGRDLRGSSQGDTIIGGAGADNIQSYAGDDTIVGSAGYDYLYGGQGNDLYIFGADYTSGGAYSTIVESSGQGTDTIWFTDGVLSNELYIWTDFNGNFWMQNQNDPSSSTVRVSGSYVSGTGMVSHVEQVVFDDQTTWDMTDGLYLRNNNTGRELFGSAHDDTMFGGTGNDVIYAMAGNDTLIGGGGSDFLYGGSGADTFGFTLESVGNGSSGIADFNLAQGDRFDLREVLADYDPLTDALSDFVQFVNSGSTNSILQVDLDGTGTTHGWTQVAFIYSNNNLDAITLEANGHLLAA